MHNLRLAVTEDVPYVTNLCYDFHKSSSYSDRPFDAEKVHRTVLDLLGRGLVLLSVEEDEIVGVLLALTMPSVFSYESWAYELAWYVLPQYRSWKRASLMLGAYEFWAKKVDCTAMSLVSLGETDELYKRKGYRRQETAYFKEI